MLYKPPNREQILGPDTLPANCAFLFSSEVELITYQHTNPKHPHIQERRYYALVVRGGLSKGGAAAGDVLLRTSDYGLTTDAAISILADEVEQRIGETIQHGENEELILVGYGNAITVEEGLSVPPEKPAAHPPAPTSAHTTVKHALEFDAILALERASFDDAIIAELESYGFLLSSIFSPENPYRRRDIYLDIEASEALGVEAAAERAKFDHEIIQHFEEHEASLVMLGGEQYLHEQYLPRPQGQKLVDGPDCKLKNAPAAREDSNQQIMADLEAYEASLEAAYLHEYQGDETQITAELEEADIFFDIFTFEECVDEKYNFEQGIISDFESWEAELQRRGEEYNRQVGPESAGTVGESARTSGDSEETSASSATLLHETAVPLESASVNATLEKYHVQEQAWWEGGEDSTSAAPPQICSENFSSEIREAFEGRGGGLRRFRGVLKEEVVAVDKFGPQNIPKEDEAIGSTPQPKRVYPNLADLVVRTSSLNQMLHTSAEFWVDTARTHWSAAQHCYASGVLDAAYVEFLLARAIVVEIVPRFPGSGSAVLELWEEIQGGAARFDKVRKEIERDNRISGVTSAASFGLGRVVE